MHVRPKMKAYHLIVMQLIRCQRVDVFISSVVQDATYGVVADNVLQRCKLCSILKRKKRAWKPNSLLSLISPLMKL